MTQVAPLPPRRQRRESHGPSRQEHRARQPERWVEDEDHGLRGRHATTRGQGFDRVVGWTVLGTLVPGLGLVVAGRRTAGRFLLTLTALALLGAGALVAMGNPVETAGRIVASPDRLLLVAAGCAVAGLLWALLVLVTHASLRRYADLTGGQRILSAGLVVALIGAGLVPALKAGSYAMVTRDTITSVFSNDGGKLSAGAKRAKVAAADPWAGVPRVNVLLIGSDAGANREGVRPDTLILASIDTKSGRTVLFSLPRNLQRVPFPQGSPQAVEFPEGFHCINQETNTNTECLLNGIWQWAEAHRDRYYPGQKNPGLVATAQAVGEVLGLGVDYYAMVNLRGFVQFVDAIGGVRVNVNQRLPIGGSVERQVATGYIEPGRNQLLDGYHALWFARSRWSTNDFDRMRRQRCVIAAVTRQADPKRVAFNFDKIAAAAKSNISTDIPLSELDAWVTLTLRVKKGDVRSLPFTDRVINTVHPDYDKIRALVATALDPAAAEAPSTTSPTPKPTRSPSSKGRGTSTTGTESTTAQDVDAVC